MEPIGCYRRISANASEKEIAAAKREVAQHLCDLLVAKDRFIIKKIGASGVGDPFDEELTVALKVYLGD